MQLGKNKMKFSLTALFLILSVSVFAQSERTDSLSVWKADKLFLDSPQSIFLFDEKPQLFIPLKFVNSLSQANRFSYGVKLFAENPLIYSRDDLVSPLLSKYHEDEKMNLFYTILGSVQAGAVGYMAYKHIKKYGFK